ncbi:MAG TPA: AMP-binding protein [Steroidobacteraceae bacterium]|jgi:acyl-coenzyme A synthetase/AMP-(fatty) acid ligase|nr:AMP-binding protein [Steroidobacteraceae bacterium]
MDSTALFSHRSAASIVAYQGGRPITAAELLADAERLAGALPPGQHLLNACVDRYRFAVGLTASLITGRVTLLPSTHTPDVIRHLLQFAPDAFCLTDDAACAIELPQFRYPDPEPPVGPVRLSPGAIAPAAVRVPQIPDDQLAAIVFTSGSTGTPLPYRKSWGPLARCVQAEAAALGIQGGHGFTLIGTVPPQHMYGFESTVLVSLQSSNAFTAERPFYPADIAAAIAAVPRPRLLVTTPVHLRTLLASDFELPALDLIVSATAPLAAEMAREAEARFKARLLEIYGSTETGQIAIRRTAGSPAFRLWPGVKLRADNGQTYAHGGHIEQMTPMCDVIELIDEREFFLHGRTADLVNVAGKRSSFGYLNAQLNAIPGVLDGAFFLPGGGGGQTGIARLAAAVVAPTLDPASLIESLRKRVDPVFLPRPLIMVGRLPRTATGKLPHQALEALADQHSSAHPARPGATKRSPHGNS